jgi:hypothetical protein
MVQSSHIKKGGKLIFQLSKVTFLEIQFVIQNEENEWFYTCLFVAPTCTLQIF